MLRYTEVNNAAPFNGQKEEHVKNLESDCRHHEEINRDNILCVILQKRTPLAYPRKAPNRGDSLAIEDGF